MAITFGNVQDRINLDYLNRTDLVPETKRALIRAIKHYEKERFWFNQTATALTLATASAGLSLPADFLALDFVTIRNTENSITQDSICVLRSFDRIAYQNRSATKGVPSEVGFYKNQLQFAPVAQSAYVATVYYTQSLTTLSADADTNDWLSAAEDLIVYHAACDMLMNVLRVPAEQVAYLKQLESESYNTLKHGRDIRTLAGQDQGVVGTIQRTPSPMANGPDAFKTKP